MAHYTRKWKFFEGWLEHKSKQARGGYERLWFVLKERTIHIFKDKENRSEDTVVGSLQIDGNTEYRNQGNDRDGYKFELVTMATNKSKRTNRFKTKKKVEMEVWRAYIVGLAKGTIPDDLDLMDKQVSEIEQDIEDFLREEALRISGVDRQRYRKSVASSHDSGFDAVSKSHSQGTKNSSGGSRSTISGGGGGPTMRHKFTNDPKMDDRVPSWFFENCSRELAEKILVNSGPLGNALMRESSSQKASGSYVISKIGKVQGMVKVEHFEVERIDRGYKIKVENSHDPQRNLTEVMNTFRFIAGCENTVLMKTNDIAQFGLSLDDTDPYHVKRIDREIPQHTSELPEPLPDYEEPVPRPKTFTPGILKKEQSKFERRTIPSPEFDPPAPHRESVYYNSKDELPNQQQNAHSFLPSTPVTPPPPDPHLPPSTAYYNEQEVLTDIALLPLPPPPSTSIEKPSELNTIATSAVNDLKGKEPYHKRSMSVPNIHQPATKLTIPSTEIVDLNQPVNRNPEPPKSVIPNPPTPKIDNVKPAHHVSGPAVASHPPVSHSTSSPIIQAQEKRQLPSLPPVPPTPPQQESSVVTDVLSPSQMGLRPVRKSGDKVTPSSSSTDNVPTPQQMGLRPTAQKTPAKPAASDQNSDDETVPSSVKDIKARFERNVKVPPSTLPKPTQGRARRSNRTHFSRHSTSSLSLTPTSSAHVTHSNNDIANSGNTTNILSAHNRRYSEPCDEYANLSDIEPINTSDEEADDTYNDAMSAKPVAKRSSFIRKLEEQIGGPKPTPGSQPLIKPMTEEEEYAESAY